MMIASPIGALLGRYGGAAVGEDQCGLQQVREGSGHVRGHEQVVRGREIVNAYTFYRTADHNFLSAKLGHDVGHRYLNDGSGI